jgi:hypothetical protein
VHDTPLGMRYLVPQRVMSCRVTLSSRASQAVYALANLAVSSKYRAATMEAGAVPILVDLLSSQDDVLRLQVFVAQFPRMHMQYLSYHQACCVGLVFVWCVTTA